MLSLIISMATPLNQLLFLLKVSLKVSKLFFPRPNLKSARTNHPSANRNPSVVEEMIAKELAKNRIEGSFDDHDVHR